MAERAMTWTRAQLSDEDRQWLRDLRLQRQVRDFTIVHATLDTPGQWGYVFRDLVCRLLLEKKKRDGRSFLLCPRARVPEVRDMGQSRREGMRVLGTEGIQIGFLRYEESRILQITPIPFVRGEIAVNRVFAGQVVVISAQPEIFLNRTLGIGTVLGGSCGEAGLFIEQLGTIGLRPVPEKRQHQRLEVGSLHILTGSIWPKTLTDLQAGHIPELAHPQALSKSFVISEDEHLVFADRPSQRSAKLVPLKLWNRRRVRSVGDIEEV